MMMQKKRLNGLPYDLIKSYFSTDKYCICGYMADWILNAANQLNINEITIDIINQTHIPIELNFHPFTYELPFLRAIITRTLIHNGFDKDFIIEATIRVKFVKGSKELECYSMLIDKESNKYSIGPLKELSYGKGFNPFDLKEKKKI